ncbi:Adaptor protein complex AP-1 gamma subunit, partial [Gonapodya prolifera JEL478]
RLKDLIKAVRACKTAADERAVIARESAFIRTQFKEENVETRGVNVAKLLYIHMLGYPAHFGQIECLKLVVSPRFSDKRLGYLGIMLLLDENQETLTLVTNSLKNDMNHPNMYVVGLALCTLGNISSPEMARDLSADVEKLLGSSNAFIRKKAALAALRIVRKVPELAENYYQRSKTLLGEKNHGVLLTGVTLLTEMLRMSPNLVTDARSLVPQLVRHLKNLVTAGFSPEHDVSGVTDPFLQIKILRLLRLLGNGDGTASEQMNDVLAQVATNTEGSKNVGNSILYEVVLTIMNIQSESSLRVLAINILGKFLSNRDNNIRYVALTTLAKVQSAPGAAPSSDSSALQRHRSTILDCLRDPDISIRRRALELSFQLANAQNIRVLARELLSFLEVAEGDLKGNVGAKICEMAASYRPNRRWEIDTVCRVLKVAGGYVEQDVVNDFIKTVSTAPTELQAYTVRKLYSFISKGGDSNPLLQQEGLVLAAIWCIGEYGEVLVSGSTSPVVESAEDDDKEDAAIAPSSEKEVLDTLEAVLKGPLATDAAREYGVTALMKLTSRFKGNEDRIRALISRYRANIDVEIQQRANEYLALFNFDKTTRDAVLDKMPVLEIALAEESQKGKGEPMDKAAVAAETKAPGAQTNGVSGGLLGGDLLGSTVPTVAAGATAGGLDVLTSLFGGAGAPGTPSGTTAKSPSDNDVSR